MNMFRGGEEAAGADPAQEAQGAAEAGGGGADDEAEPEEGVSAGAKVGTVKPGDYIVHVHVQQASKLRMEGEETSDPFIEVSCLGTVKATASKNDIASDATVRFDEHMFLEFKDLSKEQLEEATIKFQVMNKGFFKGDVIGTNEIPLTKVYNMKDHCLLHQQFGLSNPDSKDYSKITGYTTVSINVQGPGDEAAELKLGSPSEIKEKKPILPASVKRNYKQLHLRLFRVVDLPKMDAFMGTIDAYGVVKVGGQKLRTKVDTMKDNLVVWNQEMLIAVTLPVVDDKLALEIYDEDKVLDELAGTTILSIKSMIKYGCDKPMMKWVNFYGAHNGYNGASAKKMNSVPSEAAAYKGRLLVEWWAEDVKFPIMKTRDIHEENERDVIAKSITAYETMRDFSLWVEFGQGICLPSSKKYTLRLVLSSEVVESGAPVSSGQDYCRWDKRVFHKFTSSYAGVKRFPTFFIYLMDGDKPVCFYRDTLVNYQVKEAPIHWDEFDPDPAVGRVKETWKAGLFSFRVYFRDETAEGPLEPQAVPSWKKPLPKRPKACRLRCAIYQCEGLPPADSDGRSDPYVEAWTPDAEYVKKNKGKVVTATVQDTNNPIFYQVLEIPMELGQASSSSSGSQVAAFERARPIILNIWDTDEELLDSTDDYIGRAVIFLDKLKEISFDDTIPYPAWYPVKRGYEDAYDLEHGAAILASFQIVDFDRTFAVAAEDIVLNEPFEYMKDSSGAGIPYPMPSLDINEFKCEIMVLGLRDLVSTGLLPVRKAYTKFNLKSLLPPDQSKAISNITTQPREGGSNPNIRTTLQFEVKIPSDPTFTPRMTCDVYDQLFFEGMAQPHIGTFTLKLGEIIQDLREADKALTNSLEAIIATLRHIIKQQQTEGACVAEIVADWYAGQSRSRIHAADAAEDEMGNKLLEQFAAEGVSIPGSNALKGGSAARGAAALAKSGDGARGMLQEESQKYESGGMSNPAAQKEEQEEKEKKAAGKKELDKQLATNIRKQLAAAFNAEKRAKRKAAEAAREKDQEELAKRSSGGFGNVIEPQYRYDERLRVEVETAPPPESLFIALGHDKQRKEFKKADEQENDGQEEKKEEPADGGQKHYRRFFAQELELLLDDPPKDDKGNDRYLFPSPFLAEKVTRSQQVRAGGLLAGLFGGGEGGDATVTEAGKFKGIVRCYMPELAARRKEEMKKAIASIAELVKPIYETETQQPFDTEVETFLAHYEDEGQDVDGKLKKLKVHLHDKAGLGRLKIAEHLSQFLFRQQLAARLNETTRCQVRLYMIEGFNFAQRDLFSASDPYLFIKCGKIEFNEAKNYQLDTATPEFHKCFEFVMDFPGAPAVEISAYDYDDFFGDDLIGKSKLDLDDRYFCQAWQALERKPVEYRDLYHTTSTVSQGVIKMWVEIDRKDSKAAALPQRDISPAPAEEFEVRLVIWKTKDIEMMDWEGTSDVFIRAFFDSDGKDGVDNDKLTDTHWRCSNGTASFNYRLKFKLKSQPRNKHAEYKLTIQAWDKDIVASNDLIGSCDLDITPLFNDALLTGRTMSMSSKYFEEYMKGQLLERDQERPSHESIYPSPDEIDFEDEERFWLPTRRQVVSESGEDRHVSAGEILCSLTILPTAMADKYPQGEGRQEPNSEPYCPPPEGRIKLGFDPLEMLAQIIPPAMRAKIYTALCAAACLALCAMMAPIIISNIITKALIG